MNRIIALSISTLALVFCGNMTGHAELEGQEVAPENAVKICCQKELAPIAFTLAEEYNKTVAGRKVEMAVEEPRTMETHEGVSMLTSRQTGVSHPEAAWLVVIGREIVVPIISAENPYIEEIYQRGATPAILAEIYSRGGEQDWGALLGSEPGDPVHPYLMDDETVVACLAGFLGTEAGNSSGARLLPAGEMIATVASDPYAIGFCKLGSVTDPKTAGIDPRVLLLPIDRNGNGKLDYMENIYSNMNDFSRGVWIGKYPHALINNIYAVSPGVPEKEEERTFLEWVLTGGQVHLSRAGISALAGSERVSQISKLSLAPSPPSPQAGVAPGITLYILGSIILITIGIIFLTSRKNRMATTPASAPLSSSKVFCEDCLMAPRGLFYDRTHTWAFMEKDGSVRVGIDDFLGHVTGPITAIEMKKPGEKFEKGEAFLSVIQNGKKLSLYAPVSGTISQINTGLRGQSSLITSSPYDKGWVYIIDPAKWNEEVKMLDVVGKYTKWLKDEFNRLKDFFAIALPARNVEMSYVVLQDGGALREGILADMDPELWEDFQAGFIDRSR